MPDDEGPQEAPRSLGDDEIHVRFRANEGLVRQAIREARSHSERIGDSAAEDYVSVPAKALRLIVDALRLTHKTLGDTIHQDLSAATTDAPDDLRDKGGNAPSRASNAPDVADGNEILARFRAQEPKAKEALREAEALFPRTDGAVPDRGDISISAQAFRAISETLVTNNDMLMEVLRSDLKLLPPGAHTDHGDQGLLGDWWNTGDWIRD